jgi:DnaJ-domain-containing protein 1
VLALLVRLLLFAFLFLFGVLIIRRTMWALRGARPDNSADESQRPKGQQGSAPWWEVLDVSQGASLEEINQHYRQAIRLNHPGKVSKMAPEIIAVAERRAKELNAAFSEAKRASSSAGNR